MAELIVQYVDRRVPDSHLAVAEKRGDVIGVQPDRPGLQSWSERERTNSDWRIIKVRGINHDDPMIHELLEQDIDWRTGKFLRFRRLHLDLTSVSDELEKRHHVTISAIQFRGMVREKLVTQSRIVGI
jgi:hypothetical protein